MNGDTIRDMTQNTPKQKMVFAASMILLVLVIVAALVWGTKPKTPVTPPPPELSVERSTSITTMEGVIKMIAGGALYIEMDNPTELSAGALTPNKILLVAFTTKKTEFITNASDLPPGIDTPSQTKISLPSLKQGDRVLVTSAVNLIGLNMSDNFDATRVEVVR